MKENPARKGRLTILILVCVVLLIPSVVAWVVNLELGLQAIRANSDPTILGSLIPTGIFRAFELYGADLSTVTTLVPILVFLYPIIHGLKILGTEAGDQTKLRSMSPAPYPSEFVMFLVLLGLAGTLYGMLLGLQVSGVSALAQGEEAAGADVVLSIKNLLAGISTAILSSLAGLVGAFIAASPMTHIFQWAACAEDEEEQESDILDALRNLASNVNAGGSEAASSLSGTGTQSATISASEQSHRISSSGSIQNEAIQSQITALVQAIRESNNDAKNEREALKKALALYVSERL